MEPSTKYVYGHIFTLFLFSGLNLFMNVYFDFSLIRRTTLHNKCPFSNSLCAMCTSAWTCLGIIIGIWIRKLEQRLQISFPWDTRNWTAGFVLSYFNIIISSWINVIWCIILYCVSCKITQVIYLRRLDWKITR